MLAQTDLIDVSTEKCSIEKSRRPTVLAFEMQVRGHHADYVRNFADAWIRHKIQGNIRFLVTPTFYELHASVVQFIDSLDSPAVRISPITPDEERKVEANRLLREYRGWKLFCKYTREFKVDHGLMMYFDHFQLPSVIGGQPPCPYSVIYFRPTFHYPTFQNYRDSWRERIKNLRKRWVLQRVLANRGLAQVYCLDQYVVPYIIQHCKPRCEVAPIADSFTTYPRSPQREDELRKELLIEPGRKLFCLLGVLDSRKGVTWLLKALLELAPQTQPRVCILILGYASNAEAAQISELISKVRQSTQVQIIFRNGFIEGHEVQHYYYLSDVILTTYQHHMGSSAAIVRASVAEKPVLSSDYGLMGEIVSCRNLGLTVDSGDVKSIARGIEKFIEGAADRIYDREEAARYSQENSQRQLAQDLNRMLSLIRREPSNMSVASIDTAQVRS